MVIGLTGLTIVSIFLMSLTAFSLRVHGPMGEIRYQQLLSNFPWWAPLLAVIGMTLGIVMLRKYDFSYKKNFWVIVAGLIVSIILAAFVIDYLGLNDAWSRQGPMRRFYQQVEGRGQGGFYRQRQ